jgi:hypothetical protein
MLPSLANVKNWLPIIMAQNAKCKEVQLIRYTAGFLNIRGGS